jgi:hypothetical protein
VGFTGEVHGDLARHLFHALEDASAQPLAEVQDAAPEDCHHFSEFESSLSEWSFAYGIAWALIRTEEPFVSSSRLAERAREVTRAAWRAVAEQSWTDLMADDRATRGAVAPDEPASQLGDFMQKVGRTRPGRPPRGADRPDTGS